MKPNKINRLIAEHCGWTNVEETKCEAYGRPPKGRPYQWEPIPDYHSDLNAMHEAEKSLVSIGEETSYRYWLARLTDDLSYHATALQRCEAFLQTIRKWEDE